MTDNLIPISDEQAKAVEELAKATGTGLELAGKAAAYIAWVLGTVPRDLVGVLGGDWLGQVRIRNLARSKDRTEEILQSRGVTETQHVSPSLAVPLLRATADESRGELQDLWARLLANAMDPNRSTVRHSFIEAVKAMDPTDALVLRHLHERNLSAVRRTDTQDPQSTNIMNIDRAINRRSDDIEVSLRHLVSIDLFDQRGINEDWFMNVIGREFMRACY